MAVTKEEYKAKVAELIEAYETFKKATEEAVELRRANLDEKVVTEEFNKILFEIDSVKDNIYQLKLWQ